MLRNMKKKFIWLLIGSTLVSTLFSVLMVKTTLGSYQDIAKTQKALSIKRTKKRVGKIRFS